MSLNFPVPHAEIQDDTVCLCFKVFTFKKGAIYKVFTFRKGAI